MDRLRAIYVPQVEKYGTPHLGQVVTLNVGFMERLRSSDAELVRPQRKRSITKRYCHGATRQRCHGKRGGSLTVGVVHGPDTIEEPASHSVCSCLILFI